MPHPELTERILRLRQMPTLKNLPPSDLAQLAASIRARTFQKGDVMIVEDAEPRSCFLVRTGTVTMRRRGRRIGTIRAPGGVGFMSMLAQTAGGTESVAESTVEAYELRAAAMEEVFEDHFSVLLGTVKMVAERLVDELRTQPPLPFSAPRVKYEHLIGNADLGIVERIYLLRQTRAFEKANVNTLAALARRMTEMRAEPGEVLWRPGDAARHSVFIVKGMGRITREDGTEPGIVGPGYVIGGAESLIGRPRWNTFEADEPMRFLRGEESSIVDLFEDDHDFALRFLSMLATGLVAAWDRKAEQGIAAIGSGAAGESVPSLPAAPSAP